MSDKTPEKKTEPDPKAISARDLLREKKITCYLSPSGKAIVLGSAHARSEAKQLLGAQPELKDVPVFNPPTNGVFHAPAAKKPEKNGDAVEATPTPAASLLELLKTEKTFASLHPRDGSALTVSSDADYRKAVKIRASKPEFSSVKLFRQ